MSPFFCKTGNTYLTAVTAAYTNFFANYYYKVYFTSKVLMPNGMSRFQVHEVDSSEWYSPYTISSNFDAEISVQTSYFDDSIFPNFNNKTVTNFVWNGNPKGFARNASAVLSNSIRIDYIASTYNTLQYRYYKKIDWLLGIIGGGIFLFYFIAWIPCTYINRTFQKMSNAE
jgi:hypothetical protein